MSNAVVHADHDHAHAAHHPALQHHFDTMAQQKEAAVIGMWVFLLPTPFVGGLFAPTDLPRLVFRRVRRSEPAPELFWGGLTTAVFWRLVDHGARGGGADPQSQVDFNAV